MLDENEESDSEFDLVSNQSGLLDEDFDSPAGRKYLRRNHFSSSNMVSETSGSKMQNPETQSVASSRKGCEAQIDRPSR